MHIVWERRKKLIRLEHFHKSCLWLKKYGSNRHNCALPCICFTYTNVSGLHKPHWYRWKIREEQDKNSSYGIRVSVTHLLLLYMMPWQSVTLLPSHLKPHGGRASQHPGIDSFSFLKKRSSISYVWISGDNFKDSEMKPSHPPRGVQVLTLERQEWLRGNVPFQMLLYMDHP